MKLDFETYRKKVYACWQGKNVGGTLGTPFECYRGVYDVEYYTHDVNQGVLPNDDLDLQLIWLNACEKYGRMVNSEILAEHWLSYIVADWSEYGAGKGNVRNGLMPPVSGWYKNHNKDSNGCFIRSEIWACLAPGNPEIAVRYAFEDASVDHADEGLYGELFCAAMQSAAFAEDNMRTLIDIGLSYIPADCGVAKGIQTAIDCYENGLDWKEARKKVLQVVPGSFGMIRGYKDQEPEEDIPVGPLGYDAPSNIAIMIIGALYGEGDFSKSICIAAGCCEDGDCTAGTLAATMGIMQGYIEEKWLVPIGDEIKTIAIDRTKWDTISLPDTVTDLTDRVTRLMPSFMLDHYTISPKGDVEIIMEDELRSRVFTKGVKEKTSFPAYLKNRAHSITKSNALYDVMVSCGTDIHIAEGAPKTFHIEFENKLPENQWVKMQWHMPEDWQAAPCREVEFFLNQAVGGTEINNMDFTITPQNLTKGRYDLVLELRSAGRVSSLFVPVTLIVGA